MSFSKASRHLTHNEHNNSSIQKSFSLNPQRGRQTVGHNNTHKFSRALSTVSYNIDNSTTQESTTVNQRIQGEIEIRLKQIQQLAR